VGYTGFVYVLRSFKLFEPRFERGWLVATLDLELVRRPNYSLAAERNKRFVFQETRSKLN
jgi:hypothetical protein